MAAPSFALFGLKTTLSVVKEIRRDDTPFVTAYALTKTGQDVKAAEIEEMKRVFDRPTPYVLNALQLEPATKTRLTAVVGYKAFAGKGTPAEKFLAPQVDGGDRGLKSHEKALRAAGILRAAEFCVPGSGADLDAYGNMKRQQIVRILSQVGAAEMKAGYQANMTAKSRKRAIKSAGGRYIVLRPDGAAAGSQIFGRAAAGIYLRQNGRYPLIPVLMFVRAPKYKAVFSFHAVGRRVFEDRFAVHLRQGWNVAMKARERRIIGLIKSGSRVA